MHTYDWREFWDPVYPERGGRIVLEPEIFYLLLSEEGVRIPPGYAAEMTAYDPTAGELRTHYAGFFDPGSAMIPASVGMVVALHSRSGRVTSPSWSNTFSRCASWHSSA